MKRSVTVALATLCLLLPGTMAGADPGGTSQSGDAKTMRQLAAVRAAAEKIHSVVDEDQSGYAGLVVSPASSEVHLYWHGPLPAEVQDVLRDLATHVTVRVTSAEYTLSQLRAETLRLVGTARSDG